MINSTYQLTFGLELECILAFHESLLHHHLSTTTTTAPATPQIIKSIPDSTRRHLNQVSPHYLDDDTRHHDVSRQLYMGWALTTPTSYPPSRDNIGFQDQFDLHLSKYGYRAYGGEVLHIAQSLLPAHGVEIHDSFHSKKYNGDFSRWHLCHERGLVGVDKGDLKRRLRMAEEEEADRLSTEEEENNDKTGGLKRARRVEEWDTHPLELVSRVLPYDGSSIGEIKRYITTLSSGPAHFAFATKHCGLHVHVGLAVPPNHPPHTPLPTFPLPTLQHLAYILVLYQSHIDALHPPHRRSDSENIDLKSNLDNFLSEPEPLSDEEYDALDARVAAGEDPTTVYFPPSPSNSNLSLPSARAKIFSPDMTVQNLSSLMSGESGNDRYRIVNWTYVARTDGSPRTLEFRQHAATLCPRTIVRWLGFVVGMVRLAEVNSRRYGGNVEGCYTNQRKEGGEGQEGEGQERVTNIWDLMEMMELGEEEEKEEEEGWWKEKEPLCE